MIHMYHEMNVNYLVVEELLISKLFDHTCMLRIGCKPMILITLNMAKTCLKLIKVNHCRLMNHLPPEALAWLEVDRAGSYKVAQAFLCNLLCASFSLSLSLPTMPMTASSGKSRLIRVGFCTGTRHRCKVIEEGLHL
jgi:hypothetical protein